MNKNSPKRSPRNAETGRPASGVPEAQKKRLRLPVLAILCALALAISLAIYVLRLDGVVGLAVDDAWYVLLAKALATGNGYTLINSPTPGIHPFYAPGWPALLSIVFRIAPDFPANVWLLKSVATASMMGAGIVLFYYFRDEREQSPFVALALAFASTIYPALVFLATSTLMSESAFILVQSASIWLLTRGVRCSEARPRWSLLLAGSVLASSAFLVRPAALGLLVAVPLWLLKERLVKYAVVFVVVVICLVGPWVVHSRRNQPTTDQKQEQGANIVQSYSEQFWQRTAGQPQFGTIGASDLPGRVWRNVTEIALYDFGSLFFYSAYRPLEPGEPVRVEKEGRMLSLALAIVALLGLAYAIRKQLTLVEIFIPLSIGVSLAWGWEQYRLLLPLVPFLMFYLVLGFRFLAKLSQGLSQAKGGRRQMIVAVTMAWFMVLTSIVGNWQYIDRKYDPVEAFRLQWERSYAENELLMNHIARTIPKDEVIATQNPALVYLYTGNKTVASDDPAGRWAVWARLRVRYIARTSAVPLPPPEVPEQQYSVSFTTGGQLGLQLIDLGQAESRSPWPKNQALQPRD